MRTPRWWLDHPSPSDESWIAAIQADAFAGMVPEGELIDERARHLHTAEDRSTWMRNACDLRDERDAARTERDSLRAELAKAWEAGRDAAVNHREGCPRTGLLGPCECEAPPAVQPPTIRGGRAGMVPGEPWGEPKECSACSRCAGADPHCYICGCRLTIDLLKAELAEMKAIMASSTDVAWLESLSNRVKQAMDMAAEMERELESWRHGVPMSGHYTCSDTLALARVTDECDALRAQNSLLRGEADDAREQLHRALAQAWEAGRDAAADLVCLQICGCVDRIRALQPPGGKAK